MFCCLFEVKYSCEVQRKVLVGRKVPWGGGTAGVTGFCSVFGVGDDGMCLKVDVKLCRMV